MNVNTTLGPGVGPYFTPIKCIAYNRTGGAVALGEVLMLDHLGTGATESSLTIAPNTDIGADSSQPTKCWPLGNAIDPATDGIGADEGDPGAIFGVVTSLLSGAGADDTKIELTLAGVVRATTSGAIVYGDDLYLANASNALFGTGGSAYVEAKRCVAKALHSGTALTSWVLFNGLGSPGGQVGDFTT